MVSSDEIKRRLADKRKGTSKSKNIEKSSYKTKNTSRGYLICENCGGYYELQKGESPTDFGECECGGSLTHVKNLGEDKEVAKDPASSNKSTSGSILNLWSNQKTRTKIIGISSLIVILAIAGLYISHITSPTFEDKLIQQSESGVDQATLATSIENHYVVVQNYLTASQNVTNGNINYKYSSGQINATERDKQINDNNLKYQETLNDYNSIKAIQTAYINGLLNSNQLKEQTNVLYQKSSDLTEVQHLN